ncbi:MAG: SIMPL domain-containing protein [Balneolaceae bacterium]
MNVFLLSLFLIATGDGIAVSDPDQGTITVDATEEVFVAADVVNFRINISVTADTPPEVFEEHKRQEDFLSGLIREFGLDSENLTFQPMDIGARHTRESREFTSNQNVRLELTDFDLYEKIQLLLIDNGFENFRGHFSSTKMEEGRERALDQAIAGAKEKAERIAENIDRTLGQIQSVEHTSADTYRGEILQFAEMRSDSGSMMEFDQTVPVTATVRITYNIE